MIGQNSIIFLLLSQLCPLSLLLLIHQTGHQPWYRTTHLPCAQARVRGEGLDWRGEREGAYDYKRGTLGILELVGIPLDKPVSDPPFFSISDEVEAIFGRSEGRRVGEEGCGRGDCWGGAAALVVASGTGHWNTYRFYSSVRVE